MNLLRLQRGYSIPINKSWKKRILSRNYYWSASELYRFDYEKLENYFGGHITFFAIINIFMFPNNPYQKHFLYRNGLKNVVSLHPEANYKLYAHVNEFYCA